MTDRELLSSFVRDGSQDAFAELVQRHTDMVFATALRILDDRHLAEDAAQAAFLVLARKASTLPKDSVLSGWLFLTAQNAARNLRRERLRRDKGERGASHMGAATREVQPETGKTLTWDELRVHLDQSLSELPTAQRDCIVMRWLEERPLAEMAQELGCSKKAVTLRLLRGLERLRLKLRRRRIEASAALLVGMLVLHATEAAPPSLASSIQAACLGTAGASVTALQTAEVVMKGFFWTKVKTWAACAGLAATASVAGAGAWQLARAEEPAGLEPPQITNADKKQPGPVFREEKNQKPEEKVKPEYRNLYTPEIQASAERALQFLLQSQNADGSWSDAQYPSNTGITALACLALLSEGSLPGKGAQGEAIAKGIEFLLKNAQAGGAIAGKGSNQLGPMYEHCYATLLLLHTHKHWPQGEQVKKTLEDALKAIEKSQLLDGGWRYQLSREGHADLSVTANVLWVLGAAQRAGFTVSAESFTKALKYVESCALPDGAFRYRVWGLHAEPNLMGLGILALASHGRPDHPLIPKARECITADYRRATVQELKERRYGAYGSFYTSQALQKLDVDFWLEWYPKAAQVLAALQRKDGAIPDESGNTVYTSAMAAMVLQAPLGGR